MFLAVFQDELRETQDQLSTSQRAEQRSREALKEAETSLGRKDAEEMAARIHQVRPMKTIQCLLFYTLFFNSFSALHCSTQSL